MTKKMICKQSKCSVSCYHKGIHEEDNVSSIGSVCLNFPCKRSGGVQGTVCRVATELYLIMEKL